WNWRAAIVVAASLGVLVLTLLIVCRHLLRDDGGDRPAAAASRRGTIRPLLTSPVLLCFGYFVLLAAALVAVQSFLPSTLVALYETPLTFAGAALTGFLLGASAGVAVGGFVADGSRQHGTVIGAGLAGAAALFVVVGLVSLPN